MSTKKIPARDVKVGDWLLCGPMAFKVAAIRTDVETTDDEGNATSWPDHRIFEGETEDYSTDLVANHQTVTILNLAQEEK